MREKTGRREQRGPFFLFRARLARAALIVNNWITVIGVND